MKKAEDWTDEGLFHYAKFTPESKVRLIKEIQLDAYKQGMTDAAYIVNGMRGEGESDLRCVRDNIKSARDEKTTL